MKTVFKTLFLTLPLASLFLLSSCLNTDGENSQTFAGEPLVVNSSSYTASSVESRYGTLLAPELSSEYVAGTCLLANSFKINFDNQPSTNAYTISELDIKGVVPDTIAYQSTDSTIADFNTNILKIVPFRNSNTQLAYIKNFIFMQILQKETQGRIFHYKAVWATDNFTHKGYPTLYISALGKEKGTVSADRVNELAINIRDFVAICDASDVSQPDPTKRFIKEVTENGISYYELKFHIKYRIEDKKVGEGETETTIPQFEVLAGGPYSVVWKKESI